MPPAAPDFGFVPDNPAAGPAAPVPAQPQAAAPQQDFGFVPDNTAAAPQADLASAWAKAGPIERLALIHSHFAPTAAKVVPAIAKDMARGAITTAGTAGGAALGSLTDPLTGPFGTMGGAAAGNYGAQKLNTMMGLQQEVDPGQVVASALLGAAPGGAIEGGFAKNIAVQGSKAAAAGVAATTAQSLVDEGDLPSGSQLAMAAGFGFGSAAFAKFAGAKAPTAGAKALEDQTLAESRAAGLIVPPHDTNPGILTSTLGSIGGKIATKQAAVEINQAKINQIAAEDVGLNPGQPITPQALDSVRDSASVPYQKIASIAQNAQQKLDALNSAVLKQGNALSASDIAHNAAVTSSKQYMALADPLKAMASADIEGLRQAKLAAGKAWIAAKKIGGPDLENAAEAASEKVDYMEDQIDKAATAAGQPDLLDELRQSRKLIAKTYVIQKALNTSNGEVSAPIIAAMQKKNAPLTGGLGIIGRFARAFPNYAGEGARNPAAAVSAMNPLISAMAAVVGSTHGPLGAAIGAVAPDVIRIGTRGTMLSPAVQNGFLSSLARPNYGSAGGFATTLQKLAIMQQGQQGPSQIPPYLLPSQ